MHTEAQEGSAEIPLTAPLPGNPEMAAEMAIPAGANEPGPERRCASPLFPYVLLCTIVITTFLLLISTAVILEIAGTTRSVFPAVCLPGLLRSGASSRIKRWLKRGSKESENEEEKPQPPANAPGGEESSTDRETELNQDDLFFPDEIEIEWPEEDLEEFEPPTKATPVEGEASPDELSIEASNSGIADETSASRSESLSDEELMRMLGFEDDDVGSTFYSPEPDEISLQEDRPIASLIEDLMSNDGVVRRRAAEAIAEHGADAVDPLVHALAHADEARRWRIADALVMIGEEAIPALIAALGDEETRMGAATTLVRMAGPAVPPLIQALADEDEEVQFGVRYALREIGDEALPSLIEALDAPERRVRNSAATILRELGWAPPDTAKSIRYLIASEAWLDLAAYGETAVEPLIQILRSRDKEIWWNAARTLGEIGETAIEPLIDLMQEAGDEVRPLAAMALAEIGAAAVVPLIRMLENPELRNSVADALARIGEPAAEACIQALNTTDREVEVALHGVLCAIGDPAIPALIQVLISGPQRLRSRVADILSEMGWEPWSNTERACYLIAREEWTEVALMGDAGVDTLIGALNDDDDRVRREAAATLGEIGDPAAVAPLVTALAWKSVGHAAAEALVAIGEPAVAPVLALLEEGSSETAMENAVEVLGRLGVTAAVPRLIEFLRRGGDRLHRKAVDALVGIGAPAVGALIPLLDEEGDAQAGALAALIGIGDPAIPSLLKTLSDENSVIRLGVAGVLERLGWEPADLEEKIAWLIALQRWRDLAEIGGPALEHLVARLGDTDAAVQAAVMEVLIDIGTPAVLPLVSVLDEDRLRRPAEDALVQLGYVAVDTLIEALHRPQIRETAARVLVRIGAPATGALILALADPDIGDTVAGILEVIGEPAIDALLAALGHNNARVRERATGVLAALGESAAPGLIGALDHPDDGVRLGAIDTLTRIGRPITPLITESLNDERYMVRLGAAEVLDRIGWKPETEEETIRYLIAKEQWASVAAIGAAAVEPLIRMLNDPDSGIQRGAAHALGVIGAPAVMRLIRELQTEQEAAQRKAIEALKMVGEPAVLPLIEAFQDSDWRIRLGAARAVVEIGSPAVEPLIRALRTAPLPIRSGAAATLGKIGNPAAIEPLIDSLLLDDPQLWRVVVRALGLMGEPAVLPLLRVLREGDEASRRSSVEALVMIGEPAARILPAALTDTHFRVRAGVADALDRLGWSPAEGEETAVYLIAKERWSDLVRMRAVAVEPLITVLEDHDDSIRRRAAMTLGEIGDPRAVRGLINLLHDDYYSVRREAASALIAIGAPAMEEVIAALEDQDGDVRKRAADVLAEIGDRRAVSPLEALLDDEDWYARKAAEDALARIRERGG